MNQELHSKMTKQIIEAIKIRNDGAYMRAMTGEPTPIITVCLGVARCLHPRSTNGEVPYCPFCLTLPSGCTIADAPGIATKFVGGQ